MSSTGGPESREKRTEITTDTGIRILDEEKNGARPVARRVALLKLFEKIWGHGREVVEFNIKSSVSPLREKSNKGT